MHPRPRWLDPRTHVRFELKNALRGARSHRYRNANLRKAKTDPGPNMFHALRTAQRVCSRRVHYGDCRQPGMTKNRTARAQSRFAQRCADHADTAEHDCIDYSLRAHLAMRFAAEMTNDLSPATRAQAVRTRLAPSGCGFRRDSGKKRAPHGAPLPPAARWGGAASGGSRRL
jgi:hypothetical protein